MEIYKRLIAINKDVRAIDKSRKNQQQGFVFRGIDDIMNELHASFAAHGVIILPRCIESVVDEGTTSRGGVMYRVRLTCEYTFVADDGSSVTASAIGEAMDSGDKAHNKAMSIALKYILLQMFLIPTKEDKDPDAITPPATNGFAKPQQPAAPSVDPKMVAKAIVEAGTAMDVDTLKLIWEYYPDMHNLKKFKDAVNNRKKELTNVTNN